MWNKISSSYDANQTVNDIYEYSLMNSEYEQRRLRIVEYIGNMKMWYHTIISKTRDIDSETGEFLWEVLVDEFDTYDDIEEVFDKFEIKPVLVKSFKDLYKQV
jgi:hypothetical protein